MNTKFLIIIISGMIINYLLRALPMFIPTNDKKSIYIKSFFEYVPYTALAALLFPDILSANSNIYAVLTVVLISSILILKKQNNLLIITISIFIIYAFNLFPRV